MKAMRRVGSCFRSLTHCPKLLFGAYTGGGGGAALVVAAAAAFAGAGAGASTAGGCIPVSAGMTIGLAAESLL